MDQSESAPLLANPCWSTLIHANPSIKWPEPRLKYSKIFFITKPNHILVPNARVRTNLTYFYLIYFDLGAPIFIFNCTLSGSPKTWIYFSLTMSTSYEESGWNLKLTTRVDPKRSRTNQSGSYEADYNIFTVKHSCCWDKKFVVNEKKIWKEFI